MREGWRVSYRSKWSGETVTHNHTVNEAGARGWTKTLANEHGCKAVCERVDRDGIITHVTSEGSDR